MTRPTSDGAAAKPEMAAEAGQNILKEISAAK
jgi:hypothetical protein